MEKDLTPAAEQLPLSLSQLEVWLDQRAWPDSTHLNIGGGAYLVGRFDVGLLRAALQVLTDENESLRLVPRWSGGQELLASHAAPLEQVDLSDEANPRTAMRDWWQKWIDTPFAFDGTPPWRCALLRHDDSLHGLTIQFHHLVMDGWGTSQLMQRWSRIYNALARGEPIPPHNDPGYRRFVAESLAYRDSPEFAADGLFWQQQLPELPQPLFEPRHPGEPMAAVQMAHLGTRRLPRARYDLLAQSLKQAGVRLFPYFIAVLAAWFARAYGRQEVVIALPTLNRAQRRYLPTFGMFVMVFPLVVRVLPGMTVRELVAAVTASLADALPHQRYPLSELTKQLGAIRQHRDSLFDILFSYERQDYDLSFGEARLVDSRQIFSGRARYPLGITICEFQADADIELTLEASQRYFSAPEVDYLGQRIEHLLQFMAGNPEHPVAALPLLSPTEFRAMTGRQEAHAGPVAPYIRQFERQVALSPAAPAVVWDGGSLDYLTLERWANHLARTLQELGTAADRIVAVAMERSPEMLAAFLAVSKAGGAFLPLDPHLPANRLQAILDDSGALVLLVQTALQTHFAALSTRVLAIPPQPECSADAHASRAQPADLAYVLFTSGSTGRPKGVMIEHAALAQRLDWIARTWEIGPADRSGQCTQATFDPSLIELFVPLIRGASVALPPPGRISPKRLGAFVVRHGVTFMALVPSTLHGLLDSITDRPALKLRVACCGGEVLHADLARRFVDETGARLFNVYGPTEATIFATAWDCAREPAAGRLPVGRAIDATRVYVLGAQRELLPFGVAGEVYIAGSGIARGYLNRAELDREAFHEDPFFPGQRMYRTGDLGWLATDGNLHFLGRIDRQVKLRGYRIELEEIEAVMQRLDGVAQAAVKLVDSDGRTVIHAWVAGSPALSAKQVRAHLLAHLPDYMLPAQISVLPELPLRVSGKIAYDLLPETRIAAITEASRAPATPLEQSLLLLWQKALKRTELGVTDNFFDVGGDSLAALDILTGVEKLAGRPVPLFVLTENPTVEQLALALGEESAETDSGRIMLHLGRHPGSVPLYFAASGHGDLIRFRHLAAALGDDYDLFMLQPPTEQPFVGFAGLAAIYAEQITRRAQPGILAGFSIGGLAALETARQLQGKGFRVRGLCLVDTIYPGPLFRSAVLWRVLGWLTRRLNAYDLSLNGRHLGALFGDRGLRAQIAALADYRVGAFAGPVTLIKSSGLLRLERFLFRPWRRLFAEQFIELQIQGMHGSIFEEAKVQHLAAALRTSRERTDAAPAG
ncbi:non-ribosomal peptide synthetase [Rhodocyclus purpureus]|uniref:non-ribosomal peptide synthetase n=1 Tax=Rhodocyclus purpureus TaxID=1067 RepID=UPI0019136279|nr:non-ribosomal peptide synthetase [Rhodocyclus purpureus]MBK5915306.1 hypothetical protein [Rhodocyclus purpureus]